jgi:protein-S-isoprenylcysteine O-methyltransferase Ste14
VGLVGLAICANSWLALPLAALMSGAYVLMALVEEAWLERHYGASYREYCERTARFVDLQELLALIERKKPSGQTG